MKPVISVIVPVFNAKEYLRDCIDTIITQHGFEKVELILVDDGSTDVSSAICSMYAERFPNIIYYRQENSGVSSARNKGIELSSGEYVFFVDADDLLVGGTLKKIINIVKKENTDLIFFDYEYEYSDSCAQIHFPFNHKSIIYSDKIQTDMVSFMLSDSSFNAVWNKVFKSDIIFEENIRFDELKKYGEDKAFVLDYLQKCKNAFYINEVCYFYRYVESGAIQSARKDYFFDALNDYYYTVNKYHAFNVDENFVIKNSKNFLALKIISCIEMAYKKCNKSDFYEILGYALRDKDFSTKLKELIDEGCFKNQNYIKMAKNFLKGKITTIRLSFARERLKFKIYEHFRKSYKKEPFSLEYDNPKILEYPVKVTVFTPIYNRRRTINRVFDSLMEQTYKNFEWLIVDDGSNDNLRELIDQYKEKADFSIRYYYKMNGGKHTAINWAYKLTDSEYFITVDSDDAMLPETIEKFMGLWEEIPAEKRKEYWSVVGRCRSAETGEMKGTLYPENINELKNPEKEAAKVGGDKFSCPKTEILKRYPFPEPQGTTFVTECIVWNKINRDYKQYYTNQVLHECYAEFDSLSGSWYKNHIKQGYVSNYFWMSSALNEGYEKKRMICALKLGYYGYVSDKSLREIRGSIKSRFYKAVCTVEYPFLFIVKKLRYDKYSDD